MHPRPRYLLNTAEIEIWPAHLVPVCSRQQARVLASARRVLRRKCNGRLLVAESIHGLGPLLRDWQRQPGIAAALDVLASVRGVRQRALPLTALNQQLCRLGVDAGAYSARTGLVPVAEPSRLEWAGFDRYRRPLWLIKHAARAWARMQAAASADGIVLEAISGYRSHAYQLGIFQRKLQRGLRLDEILAVNAAPGFSEHHSGAALDLGTPGEPPVEESFEKTAAFAWLCAHAGRFGFTLSYPRDNPHGIVYEPWHWRYGASGST